MAAAVGERVEQAESAWERHSWLPPCDYNGDGDGDDGCGDCDGGDHDDDDDYDGGDGDGDGNDDDGDDDDDDIDHILANPTAPSCSLPFSSSSLTRTSLI